MSFSRVLVLFANRSYKWKGETCSKKASRRKERQCEGRKDMEMQNVVQRRNGSGTGSGAGFAGNRGRPVSIPQNRRPVTAKGNKDHVVIRAIRKMKIVGLRQALKPGISKAER